MRGLDVDQLSTIPRSDTQQDVTVDSDLTPDVETEGHGIGLHVHVCAFVTCRNSSPLVHVHELNKQENVNVRNSLFQGRNNA